MDERATGQGLARAQFAAELSALRKRSNLSAQDVSTWVRSVKHTPLSPSTIGDWFKPVPTVPRDNTKFLMVVECLYRAASETWTRAAEEHWKQLRARAYEEPQPVTNVFGRADHGPEPLRGPLPAAETSTANPSPQKASESERDSGQLKLWAAAGVVTFLVLAAGSGVGIWKLTRPSSTANHSVVPTTSEQQAAQSDLLVSTETIVRGHCSTIVFTESAAELGTPPADPHDYALWARDHNGAEALPWAGFRLGQVQLNLSGTSSRPVTITSVTAEVVDRQPGLRTGTTVSGQCGGETTGRLAEIDLDTDPPKITGSNADPKAIWGSDDRATPLKFPYTVTDRDTELLLICAEVRSEDTVSYRLHIGWTDGQRSGNKTVDNGGKPFKVATANPTNPMYRPSGAKLIKMN
ncbi:hypothetical protein [Nocardia sp. NPDC056000]|uniref:hypothetical protein n=1 Tax=Nocardia sp. NPDC056000 TaxID=3345674 RepID=UPI0035DE3EAF